MKLKRKNFDRKMEKRPNTDSSPKKSTIPNKANRSEENPKMRAVFSSDGIDKRYPEATMLSRNARIKKI